MPLGGFGGGVVGGAVVELLLNDTEFKGGLGRAEAQLKGFGAQSNASMGGFASYAKSAFTVAGAAAVAFTVLSIKAYEEHQVVLSQLQNAISRSPALIGETTKAFEAQAMTLQNLTGYEHDQVLAADTVLSRFQLTGKQIRDVIPTVLDYARATGQDVPAAAGLVAKALLGNARALKTVGIQFHATGNTAKDMATILGDLKAHVGGVAAAFGQTLPGQIQRLNATLKTFEEEAGAKLAPAVTLLVTALGQLLTAAGPSLVAGMSALASGIASVSSEAALAVEALTKLAQSEFFKRFSQVSPGLLQDIDLLLKLGGSAKSSGDHVSLWAQIMRDTIPVLFTTGKSAQTAAGGIQQAGAAAGAAAGPQAAAALQAQALAAGYAAAYTKALELKGAVLGLAGGFLGIQGAALSLRGAHLALAQAQVTLNKDIKAGNTPALQLAQDHLALNQALLGGVQAQQSLAASVVTYLQQTDKAGTTTAHVTKVVDGLARQFGFTKGQTDALNKSVDTMLGLYGKVPAHKSTKFDAPGLTTLIGNLDRVAAGLAALQNKDIYVTTHYATSGRIPGATYGPHAAGAVFAGGPGGAFRAGEGSYQTPFGTGSEIVSNRGVLPLSHAIIRELGQSVAQASGGGGPTVHVHVGTLIGGSAAEIAESLGPAMAKVVSREIQRSLARMR